MFIIGHRSKQIARGERATANANRMCGGVDTGRMSDQQCAALHRAVQCSSHPEQGGAINRLGACCSSIHATHARHDMLSDGRALLANWCCRAHRYHVANRSVTVPFDVSLTFPVTRPLCYLDGFTQATTATPNLSTVQHGVAQLSNSAFRWEDGHLARACWHPARSARTQWHASDQIKGYMAYSK